MHNTINPVTNVESGFNLSTDKTDFSRSIPPIAGYIAYTDDRTVRGADKSRMKAVAAAICQMIHCGAEIIFDEDVPDNQGPANRSASNTTYYVGFDNLLVLPCTEAMLNQHNREHWQEYYGIALTADEYKAVSDEADNDVLLGGVAVRLNGDDAERLGVETLVGVSYGVGDALRVTWAYLDGTEAEILDKPADPEAMRREVQMARTATVAYAHAMVAAGVERDRFLDPDDA